MLFRSLPAFVVRARMFVRAHGWPDGLDAAAPQEPAPEWSQPPLSVSLKRTGGIDGLAERVEAFMDSAVPM